MGIGNTYIHSVFLPSRDLGSTVTVYYSPWLVDYLPWCPGLTLQRVISVGSFRRLFSTFASESQRSCGGLHLWCPRLHRRIYPTFYFPVSRVPFACCGERTTNKTPESPGTAYIDISESSRRLSPIPGPVHHSGLYIRSRLSGYYLVLPRYPRSIGWLNLIHLTYTTTVSQKIRDVNS